MIPQRGRARALMDAARVPETVEPETHGLWTIQRFQARDAYSRAVVGYPSQTRLFLLTAATLHLEGSCQPGDLVMEDSETELSRHLAILMVARGRVLVTGLGLGCVARGLAAKPEVDHVDVLELDPWIIRKIGPTLDPRKVTVHQADALRWTPPAGARWDFAWHDVHDMDHGGHEEMDRLVSMHFALMMRFAGFCERQGAWQMPRTAKRRLSFPNIIAQRPQRRRRPWSPERRASLRWTADLDGWEFADQRKRRALIERLTDKSFTPSAIRQHQEAADALRP